jgi:hypothetical protein
MSYQIKNQEGTRCKKTGIVYGKVEESGPPLYTPKDFPGLGVVKKARYYLLPFNTKKKRR